MKFQAAELYVALILCTQVVTNSFRVTNDQKSITKRIVGGQLASINRAPYLVSVEKKNIRSTAYCGGGIISKSYVLTASHCVENETLVVRSGSSLFGSGGEVYNVVEKTKYPNSEAVKDDIALLKLDRPIKFSKIQSPIALALPTDTWASGKKLFVCGFGRTQLSKAPDSQLRCTKIRIVPEWYCRFAYRQSLREKNKLNEPLLCGGNHESDTCKGDSGSPAVLNQKLFGLVAGGDNCGSYVFPNIYTVVPRYYDWILKNVGSEADFVRQLSVKNETRRSF